MQDRSVTDSSIAYIYLPVIGDQDVESAESHKWSIWRAYRISAEDCLTIVRAQRTIFNRLLRIDPVLRRPRCGVEPFATRLVYPTKDQAKNALQAIHRCFDKYTVPPFERREYLRAIGLRCLLVMHSVHAEVQLRTEHPARQ